MCNTYQTNDKIISDLISKYKNPKISVEGSMFGWTNLDVM